MNNTEFLKKYHELQYNIMYDKAYDLGFAYLTYSDENPELFWNRASVDKFISSHQIDEIDRAFNKMYRKPAFYFEKSDDSKALRYLLSKKNYIQKREDAWYFYEKEEVDKTGFEKVIKVHTEKYLDIFIDTMKEAYNKLGSYEKVVRRIWKEHHKSNRVEYFIIFFENKPVAVSTLSNYGGIGYISNIGSLKNVRGKGFGKIATLYAVQRSIENENKVHALSTNEEGEAKGFYDYIGFTKKFTAVGFVKG